MSSQHSDTPSRSPFVLPPSRTFGLRDGAQELDASARADVPRVVVETSMLAQVVGQRGVGEEGWVRIRAEVWERALRDAHLLSLVEDPSQDAPPSLSAQLRAIRERLAEVHALEQRLGQEAEEGGTIPKRDADAVVVALCLAGMVTAFAPAELRPLLAMGFTVYGVKTFWTQFSPRAKVGREQLAAARRALALAVQSFLEHTWVSALGDRVIESTPHAVYLNHRLMDLDAARGAGEARVRELRGLMARIREANQSLGRAEEDAETARLQRQLDELQGRLSQIDRLRADCATRAEAHLGQLDRQRAIAARRALSSRVSNLVDRDADDASQQQIAVIEVDIADIAARLRNLDVEIGSADAELRSVLEVSGVGGAPARQAPARRKTGSGVRGT